MSRSLKPSPFSNILFFAVVFLLLTILIVTHIWEYGYDVATAEKRENKEADETAERIRISIIQLAEEASGGGRVLDKYVDSLNHASSLRVSIIHSESIDAQYGSESEEDEQPQNQNEREALVDGKPRRATADGQFVRVLPLKAEAQCVPCHHLPGTAAAGVPVGYVLGLVEVKLPAAPTLEERRGLLQHTILAVGLTLLIAGMFVFALYQMMGMLRSDIAGRIRNEEAARRANEDLKAAMANLEKATSTLVRQEKLASIGTLSAGVAHEILNPLNIIGTIVQLMQMDECSAKMKENLAEIMTQIRRAATIANNLRMFAQQKRSEAVALDVHALFDQTVSLLQHDLNQENITVEKDYGQDLPLIFAGHDQLAQVFLNLINNARQALREVKDGGKKLITIKTRAFPGTVEISLSNNGPRIPEDIIGKIFDPFFTTKDPNKGTGLGLSIAHTFVQVFGGTIGVQNQEVEGVTFIITLPTTDKKAEEWDIVR